jgi:hypothetical protein
MTYFLCKMGLAALGLRANDDRQRKNIMKAHGDYLQSWSKLVRSCVTALWMIPKGGTVDFLCKRPNGG